MTETTYINPKAPDHIKVVLNDLLTGPETLKARYRNESEDDEFWFGGCPVCGLHTGVKHLGKADWLYCEEHKTAWCAGFGLFSKNWDESDSEVVSFFENGGFCKISPIYSRLELPENRAAMLEDLKHVPVAYSYQLNLIDGGIESSEIYDLHPLPDSCDMQVRFSQGHMSAKEKLALVRRVVEYLVPLAKAEDRAANEEILF